MKITNVIVRKAYAENKLKAYATITLDDELVIHNIKLIEGKNEMFISMPSKKVKSGEYKDIVHPISAYLRSELQARILQEYNNGAILKTLENSENPEM